FVPTFSNHTWDSVAFDFIISIFYVHVIIPFDLFSPGVMPEFELPEIEYMTEVGYRQELSYASPEITIISPPQIELSTTQSSIDITKSEERDDGENADYYDDEDYQMKDVEFEFGPLFEESIPIGFFEFTWFNETWEMDGFLLDTVIPGIATYLYPRPYLDMSIDAQDVLCFGDTTGVVTVTALHSSGPYTYTYSWGTENTHMGPSDHIIVPAGYYYATITDVYGCSVNDEINVADENPPLALSLYSDDVLCAGEPTGNLYSYPSGGVPPYTFDWQPSSSTEQNPEGVYAGWHYLTVTDDVGCTIEDSVFIDEPEKPLLMTWEFENVSCFGFTDAYIDITVTGGTPPYFYSWSNNVMTEDLYNLGEGSYSVTVLDSHGCDIEHTFVIIQPTELEISLDIQNILCYGDNTGSVVSHVTGGTPPYTYTWNNGASTPNINDLYAGIYELSVTDANGCEVFAIARVEQPDLPLSLYIEPTDVRCFAEANGIADLTVIGGTPPYYYYWSNGEISEDLYDLEPGLYSVTVFDEHDCVAYAQTQIYQPVAPLTGTIDGTNVTCNGDSDGNVYIDVSGGVPPYHYNWSNGSWGEDQFNITAGNYSVTITDANYCHYTLSYEVTEPDPWTIDIIENPTVCAGQNATVGLNLVTGNTPPYVIMWDNGSTGMTTNVSTSILDSINSFTVTAIAIDANNCISDPIPITINVLEPLGLEIVQSRDSVCPGEYVSFDIEITGGGIPGNQIYVNDSLHNLPVGFQIFNDTVFEFVVYDSCNFKHKRIVKEIKTLPLPPIYVVADKTYGCAPLSVLFRETSPNVGQTYLWNFDDGDFENLSLDKYPVHTFFNSTTYHVNLEVTGTNGCKTDTTVGILVYPVPRAEFRASATKVHMASPAVSFTNYTEGGFYFNWDFGDGAGSTETNPQHKFSFPGVYHVLMTTESLYGCVDSTGVDITVSDETLIYAPTAFTPNDDQINDSFRVVGEGIDKLNFKMEIYNRWGERIFETDDYETGWHGMDQQNRRMPQGVYTWIIYFKDPFGNLHTKTGQVTLLK
ncbi:MAG: T9SS type B sorting domain-containing protein, partial [Bacteroidales bacterium]|nr:T9SS type B sorting domain-containing protein [Bacteroidales bacterium]